MRLYMVLSIVHYFFELCECYHEKHTSTEENNYLNALQTIGKYGYPSEGHIVRTVDGYLLEMHRIPHGKYSSTKSKSKNLRKKPPILIHHGLFSSSAAFIIHGPNKSLAFLLADLGYDVWLGNSRGSIYSRAHVSLNPNDSRFWNFTWHESGIFDLPAEIDYICSQTKQEKVIYIGYSMGTTMFFVLTSTLPEYNDKIELSLLLAPVGFLKNLRSPFLKILSLFNNETSKAFSKLREGSKYSMARSVLSTLCEISSLQNMDVVNAYHLNFGPDPKSLKKILVEFVPCYLSTGFFAKEIEHYAQLYKSGKFRQYDYGLKGNKLHYGSLQPPDYDVQEIRVPIHFYLGKHDYLSTKADLKLLIEQLPISLKINFVNNSKFSHHDFIESKNVNEELYNQIIKDVTAIFGS